MSCWMVILFRPFICMRVIFIDENLMASPTVKHISIITFRKRVINSIQRIYLLMSASAHCQYWWRSVYFDNQNFSIRMNLQLAFYFLNEKQKLLFFFSRKRNGICVTTSDEAITHCNVPLIGRGAIRLTADVMIFNCFQNILIIAFV